MMFSGILEQVRHVASSGFISTLKGLSELKVVVVMEELIWGRWREGVLVLFKS